MSDLVRLRDQLYAVVLATPLLSCSGSSPRAQDPEPAAPDAAVMSRSPGDAAPPDAAPPDAFIARTPPRQDPWPAEPRDCSGGASWCGTIADVETHHHSDDLTLRCPEHFYEGVMSFDLELDDTKDRRRLGDPETCCYTVWNTCPGGRPYGAPVIAGAALVERWLAAAQAEHASVASFARASLELLAVGAPPSLIAACHRAALDELRHTSACLAIASRLAGRELAVAPVAALAPRGGGVVRVAVDTYLEGCVAETFGALVAARALDGCTDADATRALRRIARDEARHAELAWQIVAWSIEVGGARVRAALVAAAHRLGPPRCARVADPSLAGSGQLDDAGLDAAAVDVWREIIAPLTDRLLAAA